MVYIETSNGRLDYVNGLPEQKEWLDWEMVLYTGNGQAEYSD